MTGESRQSALELLGHWSASTWKSIAFVFASLTIALTGAYVPEHAGLEDPARAALFILIFCACLWVTEAMPAFSVSLLAIGLSIVLIGQPHLSTTTGAADWQKFMAPWGSPLIWLFFGGFILAKAAERTGLDRWLATVLLKRMGQRPALVLLGVMAITAALSMFISNTATATLMIAALAPLYGASTSGDSSVRPLLLGVAVAANLGGMGTVIGSPPNAIAAGAIQPYGGVNFAEWMYYGIPPMLVLLALAWLVLTYGLLRKSAFQADPSLVLVSERVPDVPPIQQLMVVVTFILTISLWLTQPFHGIPTTVVSFLPICILTTTSILGPDDIRRIPWEVLLLITGGLSLGVAMTDTGLAKWLVTRLPIEGFSTTWLVIAFCYVAVLLSNLMSNTAAANMLIPLTLALVGGAQARLVIPISLCASLAMCLPISTPPNAIVYGSRRVRIADLMILGLLVGVLGPIVVTFWTRLISS